MMIRVLVALIAGSSLAACGDGGQSKIYGKWGQGDQAIEFREKSVTIWGMPAEISRYEIDGNKINVFMKDGKGMSFVLQSANEICSEPKMMFGCLKKQ